MITLCEHNHCTGCGACYISCPQQAIHYTSDTDGFFFPSINEINCNECGICRLSCPVLSPITSNNLQNPDVYAGWSNDHHVRTASSSGGIFSTIADYVLQQKGVVYGAAFDSQLNLRHIAANSQKELPALRGSKYIQSDASIVYREIRNHIQRGKLVAFSGTPCQIAGLMGYLGELKNSNNLLLIDIVCHGVPSRKLFLSYLNKLATTLKIVPQEICNFIFRKLYGWGYESKIVTTTTSKKLKGLNNLFMGLYHRGWISRESCYTCTYTRTQRLGDITLADFWGIGKTISFKYNRKFGVSLVLVNSLKGKTIINAIRSDCYLIPRDIDETLISNTQLKMPTSRPSFRNGIYHDFNSMSLKELEKKYLFPSFIKRYRHYIGTFKSQIIQNIIRILK